VTVAVPIDLHSVIDEHQPWLQVNGSQQTIVRLRIEILRDTEVPECLAPCLSHAWCTK
jgi:hypothetical protein